MTPNCRLHLLSKNNKGRTMIEVLIAMAIFAIGFVVVGRMVLSTTRNNTTGNLLTTATMLAQEKIEYLKTLPIQYMQTQCSEDLEAEHLGNTFKRSCNVSKSFSETTKIIQVTVSWNRKGQNREVVLRTLTRGNGA
ncbi:MAG: prepilin-type N-terminal cleavage/methylation domain-containing protein [Desulfobacterales bacterium]